MFVIFTLTRQRHSLLVVNYKDISERLNKNAPKLIFLRMTNSMDFSDLEWDQEFGKLVIMFFMLQLCE